MRHFMAGASVAAVSLAFALPASAMQYRTAAIPSVQAQRDAVFARLPTMTGSHDFTVITASKAPADLATLKAYFTKFGFAVTETKNTHDLILHGTYGEAGRASRTSYVVDRAHTTAFVRTAARVSFPANVARLVAGTSFSPGLRQHSYMQRANAEIQGPTNGYAPQDIASVYDINPVYASGITGTGVNVAIAACSTVNASDVTNYGSTFGLPAANIHYIPVDGTTTDEDGEAVLDAERVYGTAPGAAIYEYLAPDCYDSEITDMFAKIADDNATYHFAAVSHSYGGDEEDYAYFGVPDDLTAESAALAEINKQHVPIFVASGDNGAWGDLFDNETDVSFPASDSSAISVGATTLETGATDKRLFEYGWSGSGGGVSDIFTIPAYQKIAGVASAQFKNVPDVSMVGDPETGVAEYWANNIYGAPPLFAIGGTSVSAPTFTGVWALVDQKRVQYGIGYSVLPGSAIYTHRSAFTDITQGTNGYYPAAKGYDNVTGVGTPDVAAMNKAF